MIAYEKTESSPSAACWASTNARISSRNYSDIHKTIGLPVPTARYQEPDCLAGASAPRGDFIRTGCRSAQLSGCLKIFAVAYGLQPFVGGFCARNFYGEMGKPTVRRCPVPMLHPRRNIHHIARMQFLRRLAFLLIKAASGNADENLPTAALCVMNMSVVAATRFKSHVINADLRGGQWRQITLPDKVPGKSVVGCADREHHLTLMLVSRIGDSVLLCPNFFRHAERRPRLGPEKATAYPVTIFSLHFFFSNSSVLTLASRFNDRVERSRLIKFHLLCQYS